MKTIAFQAYATSFWKMKMKILSLSIIKPAIQANFQDIAGNCAIINCLLKMSMTETFQALEFSLQKTGV